MLLVLDKRARVSLPFAYRAACSITYCEHMKEEGKKGRGRIKKSGFVVCNRISHGVSASYCKIFTTQVQNPLDL